MLRCFNRKFKGKKVGKPSLACNIIGQVEKSTDAQQRQTAMSTVKLRFTTHYSRHSGYAAAVRRNAGAIKKEERARKPKEKCKWKQKKWKMP